jgi:hypothetical protein
VYATLVLAAALAAQPDPKAKPDAAPALPAFAADAMKPDDKDSPLRKLQKERARERADYLAKTAEVIRVGNWDTNYYQQFLNTQAAFAENLAELMDKPADKVRCYEMRVEALKESEKFIAGLVNNGKSRPQELNLAKAARIDAEIDLLKLRGPDAKPAAADDPDALVKQSIADMKALAAALENKDRRRRSRPRPRNSRRRWTDSRR